MVSAICCPASRERCRARRTPRGISLVVLTGVAARSVDACIGVIVVVMVFMPKFMVLIIAIPGPVVASYYVLLVALLFMDRPGVSARLGLSRVGLEVEYSATASSRRGVPAWWVATVEFPFVSLHLILDCLNRERIRCTYGAVAAVIGGVARGVGQRSEAKDPRNSWIVNKETGKPTGCLDSRKHRDLHQKTLTASRRERSCANH